MKIAVRIWDAGGNENASDCFPSIVSFSYSALTSHGSSSSLSDDLETADESLSNASSLMSLESSPPPQEIQESPLLKSSLDQPM